MKSNRYIYYAVLFHLWTSCVSEKELVAKIDSSNIKSTVEIENVYLNKNKNKHTYQNLIEILNYQKKSKIVNNSPKFDNTIGVKIHYDGIENLNISYKDTCDKLIDFNLKVENKGNYLTFKRKIKRIPIPFIFTYYWNEKSLIYMDNDENLNIISGLNQFVWIILGGGGESVYENKFEIQKKQ